MTMNWESWIILQDDHTLPLGNISLFGSGVTLRESVETYSRADDGTDQQPLEGRQRENEYVTEAGSIC
jgi:hypothetical protein